MSEFDKSEMLWIASKYATKRYSYEQLKYGDEMFGREDKSMDVWKFVEEFEEIGRKAFYEKYSEYKLY